MRFIIRNLGYLYGRYKVEFYFISYIYMIIGLALLYMINNDIFEKDFIIFYVLNIITYPFTRFFYYSCKESVFGEVYYSSLIVIGLKYICKFLVFIFLWALSFIPGTFCMIYILLNENAKEYNRRKAIRNDDDFYIDLDIK